MFMYAKLAPVGLHRYFPSMANDTKSKFSHIYANHVWGGESKSGIGSNVANARPYVERLQPLIDDPEVERVLDLGCGDWTFSQHLDLTSVEYVGIDIVPDLVNELTERYGAPNIEFVAGNFLDMDLPDADLLICKDVLQHLSREQVDRFIERLAQFPRALLTNDQSLHREGGWRRLWQKEPIGTVNIDIQPGEWRPLRLREPPYGLEAKLLGTFNVCDQDVTWTKEMLLWQRA